MLESGLLQILWSSKHRNRSFEGMQRFRSGLKLWKAKWDLAVSKMTPKQKHGSGFLMNAAPEFWHLAHYIVSMNGDTTGIPPDDGSTSSSENNTGVFKHLLRRARSLG